MTTAVYKTSALTANGGSGGSVSVTSTADFVAGATVILAARNVSPLSAVIGSVDSGTALSIVDSNNDPIDLSAYTTAKHAIVTQPEQNDVGGPSGSYVQKTGDTMTGALTVQGLIHSTTGGFKFPDGTTQTTAGGGGGSGTITGSGTSSYVPKWTGTEALGNSQIYDNGTNVGVGTSSPTSKLHVNGSFAATTKSFDIPHQTIPGGRLKHGVLEGPEHGVYIRGKLMDGQRTIVFPEYWEWLIDWDTITIHLTPIRSRASMYVEEIQRYGATVGSDNDYFSCYYLVYAERKDVDKIQIEVAP